MARVTVEDCLDRLDNRFALVLLVSKRAKQILRGASPTVQARSNKYIVTALREVAAGHVRYESPEGLSAENLARDVERDLNR
jgi:DNA-directed RNA polymerase subunit omega